MQRCYELYAIESGEFPGIIIKHSSGKVEAIPSNMDEFQLNIVHSLKGILHRKNSSSIPVPDFYLPIITAADTQLIEHNEAEKYLSSGCLNAYCYNYRRVESGEDRLQLIPRPYFHFQNLTKLSKKAFYLKYPKAIFRGSLSSEWRLLLWTRWLKDKKLQKLVDAGITKIPEGAPTVDHVWCVGCPKRWAGQANVTIVSRIEMSYQQDFRYVISIDGAGCADRFGNLLGGSFVVLKQESPLVEEFYHFLTPWKHYVPIARDFTNLADVIETLNANLTLAEQIVANANAFAWDYFSREKMDKRWMLAFSLNPLVNGTSRRGPSLLY